MTIAMKDRVWNVASLYRFLLERNGVAYAFQAMN